MAHLCHKIQVEVRGPSEELVLSFHHVDAGDPSLVIGFGGKCYYPLSHLTSPHW